MSIDRNTETIFSLIEARDKIIPGKRICIDTLNRWVGHGIGPLRDRGDGVMERLKLEVIRCAGIRYTSLEAIERFLAAQNQTESFVPKMTQGQRHRQGVAAMKELAACGV